MTIFQYFLENDNWYKIKKGGGFEIKEYAPEKAKKSYYEYIGTLKKLGKSNGSDDKV